MTELIALFLFVLALYMFPHLRNIVLHPFKSTWYALIDLYARVRYMKKNECPFFGKIIAFCSDNDQVFGCGKTLSSVWKIVRLYRRYNNKKVWDKEQKKFVKQHIKILSNVHFKPFKKFFGLIKVNIEYEYLSDCQQIVEFHNKLNATDVGIVFIDEASTQFNSRNFKTNISTTLLNSMLTCRHRKFGMILTAQRFNQIDALIRQITSEVHMCSKLWRSEVVKIVSAYDLEYVTNLQYIKSRLYRYFVPNWLYRAYDTSAIVEDIKRKQESGELLSDAEVLELQGTDNGTYFNAGTTRKFRKLVKG